MITADRITVERSGRVIIQDIDLCVDEGSIVGVVGPNGSGKSTLLLALYRALDLAGGKVTIDEKNLASMSRRAIASQMAVVSQERDSALPLSVRDSVALGRLATRSLVRYGDEADQVLIDEALDRVELTDLADRLITQLSGGERQRVMIARAIVQQSSHLLLDEPTNHLDLRYQFALLDLILSLGCTTVIVLHDLNLAARYCDHIILLEDGKLAAGGSPTEVLRPEVLEPIYRLNVTTVDHNGRPHLLFEPSTN